VKATRMRDAFVPVPPAAAHMSPPCLCFSHLQGPTPPPAVQDMTWDQHRLWQLSNGAV